uniref:Reverse transcriptase domain-containing protein n=1 Tax=Nelumbo nucifera TaxID=4432 RepID=A0A822ZV90_NELNU|nr:TPA_asm: hypothetical protein HUJ06_019099 [Nelumbo nucifera]
MICLSWNCRGLGNPRAVHALRELIHSYKPDVIFLIETLVHIGFVGAFAVDRDERGGGIAFLWKAPNMCSLSNNHINAFYGYPNRSHRRESWNLLCAICASSRLPWCCIGDFNDMLSPEDKQGRLDHPNWLLARFRETISDYHLHEISIIGSCFTWERETVSVSRVHRHLRFRFENGWLWEPGLNKTVEDAWSLSRMGDVSSRLDQCGKALAKWGSGLNKKFTRDIAQCKAVIERLRDNSIPSDIETIKEKKIELLKLLGKEEDYWRQRSKSFWLRDGDANTKYFHATASTRKRTSRISRLMDDEGNWHDDPSSLCQVVQDYFRKLFSLSSSYAIECFDFFDCKVSDSDNEKLLSPFSFEEFKEVVFQMHPDKSPTAVSWLSREEFPASLNGTTIVLIPKCESPKTMKDLRPISLCNVLYKIVSKVLANRLKVLLSNIILNAQSAFVGPIIPNRGLHQGDPLSPYLFILCAEGLSALMYKAEREGLIYGYRICQGAPSVSHLLFADNSFFFFKAEERECNSIKNILKVYEEASGQAINFSEDVKARVTSVLGVVNPINAGRYLGLPSLIGRKKKEVFRFIRDRLWQRLQGWKSKLLSRAGKEILIKYVAQVVPSYCMSTFMIHVSLSKELERMMNSFWWGNSYSNGGGIKWLRWEKVCVRKEEGGMGNTCEARLEYPFQPDALVCHVFKAKYFLGGDFLVAQCGHNPSYTWKSIWHSRIVLEKGCRWRIGDGYVKGLEDIVVSDLWIPGHKEWDVEMIHELFGPRDASAILNIPLSYASQEDRLIWHLSLNGVYSVKSVKSGYRVARDLNTTISQDVISGGWDKLWKLPIPPKAKSFLARRGIQLDTSCHLCNTSVESRSHVLLSCPYTQACWSKAGISVNVSNNASFGDCLLEFLAGTDYDKSRRACMVLWSIWSQRNSKLWRNNFKLSNHVRLGMVINLNHQGNGNWCAPPPRSFKCNVDAASFTSSNLTRFGIVIRDELGAFMKGYMSTIPGLFVSKEGEVMGHYNSN